MAHHVLFGIALFSVAVATSGLLLRGPLGERLFARKLKDAIAGFKTLTSENETLASGNPGFHEVETIIRERYLKDSQGNPVPGSVKITTIQATNQSSGIGFGKTGVTQFHQLSLKVTFADGKSIEGKVSDLRAALEQRFGESKLRRWSNLLIAVGIGLGLLPAVVNYVSALSH